MPDALVQIYNDLDNYRWQIDDVIQP